MESKFFSEPQAKCLESLVGISQKQCDCFPEIPIEKIELIKTSTTGYFVDEHEGASSCLFLTKAQCGDNDIWDRLIRCRRESIMKLILDVAVDMNLKLSPRNNYKRQLGENSYGTLINLTAGRQTISLPTKKNNGGKIRFNGMGFIAKLPPESEFEIIRVVVNKRGETTEIASYDYRIDKIKRYWGGYDPDTSVYDIEPFELLCDGSEYEISYDYDPAKFIPYDNNLTCNCEGAKTELKRFFSKVPDGMAKGFVFDVDYLCDDQFLLCALANAIPTVKYLIAETIRTGTMLKFLTGEKIRATTGTTSSNVLNVKNLDDSISMFSLAYSQSYQDIVKTYNVLATELDCFSCNPLLAMGRKQALIVSNPNTAFVGYDTFDNPNRQFGNGYYSNEFLPNSNSPFTL